VGLLTVAAGTACGLLAGAVALSVRSGPPPDAGRRQAIRVVAGVAAALLLAAAVIILWEQCREATSGGEPLWIGAFGALVTRQFRLFLISAVAALPGRSNTAASEPRKDVLLLLPSPLLAGAALILVINAEPTAPDCVPHGAAELARPLAVLGCSVIAARALGASLARLAAPGESGRLAPAAAAGYVALTLLVGGTALASLLLRGTPWGLAADEVRLGGAWMAWSTAWFAPRRPARLRQALSASGSALLLLAALL
jgi:hypothetical protein